MNRGQRATRNNPTNKPFVSGGVISNFTGASQAAPDAGTPTPVPAPTSNNVSNNLFIQFIVHMYNE